MGVLSDIHGNFRALGAVLSDMERRGGVDRTVCLGDVAATGPQPKEVIDFLRGSGWSCVMGNMDEQLARNIAEEVGANVGEQERMKILGLDAWTRRQVSASDRRYLAAFRPTVELRPKGGPDFLTYHGSPRSNVEGIFPTTSDVELRIHLKGREPGVLAGGHTHAQMLRRLDGSVIINPGSVGYPFDRTASGRILHPAHAEYAIVSAGGDVLEVELIAVPYPLSELREDVEKSGLPDPRWWMSDWY
ncbi:MAG: metallophosphoesterase family protein [Thaumarchaeota archaeon]|nr:metallophosphoesterase family protein [Nitrososphaerota archaeon]